MTEFAKEANSHFTHLLDSMDDFLAQQSIALETAIVNTEHEQKVILVFNLEIPLIIGIEVAAKLRDRIKQVLVQNYDSSKFTIEEVLLEKLEICNTLYENLNSLDEREAIITTEMKLVVTKKNSNSQLTPATTK